MTPHSPDSLEALVRDAGEGWLIDWYLPKQDALPRLRRVLAAANDCLRRRQPDSTIDIDERSLLAEYCKSPHKVRAFLQAAGESESPDMLVMAWRLLQGAQVAEVELRYHAQKDFVLRVILRVPKDHAPEIYESNDIDDAAIFRHFGILKMDNQPVFDGFYALQR